MTAPDTGIVERLDDDATLLSKWAAWAAGARRSGPIVVDRSVLLRGVALIESQQKEIEELRGLIKKFAIPACKAAHDYPRSMEPTKADHAMDFIWAELDALIAFAKVPVAPFDGGVK